MATTARGPYRPCTDRRSSRDRINADTNPQVLTHGHLPAGVRQNGEPRYGRNGLDTRTASPMPDLTRREAKLLEAFEQHVERTGVVPTRTELRIAMGWESLGTVQYFLNRLTSKGAIEIVHGESRGVGLASPVSGTDDIPIIGRLVPDADLLAEENIEDTVSKSTAAALFRTRTDFLLRVQDDSMAGAGIRAGDLVAAQKASDAGHGSMVVASVAGEASVRRLLRDNGHAALVPDNPDFQRISFGDSQFEIKGIVVGSVRHRTST